MCLCVWEGKEGNESMFACARGCVRVGVRVKKKERATEQEKGGRC